MSLVWTAAVVIFFVVCLVTRAQQQHSCYVCISGSSAQEVVQLFPHDTLLPCRSSSQVKICPEGFKGCLTESKGSEVTRTCARLAVDGCRSANGVEYCYCRGDLCNMPPMHAADVDDEDMAEGSGVTEATTVRVTTENIHHNRTTAASTSSRTAQFSILPLILVVSCCCW